VAEPRETLMLRITQASTTDAQTTLRLEGDIRGQWVEELRRECDRALGDMENGARLVLDLAQVSSIDARGVTLLRELSTRRVLVENCSPYVAELLKGVLNVDR
jgi:ABC-type transporter Mla MlaB component